MVRCAEVSSAGLLEVMILDFGIMVIKFAGRMHKRGEPSLQQHIVVPTTNTIIRNPTRRSSVSVDLKALR